jgi:cytochrome oxidase Cu insertion factor (SCO1/SenC/PrrC family)
VAQNQVAKEGEQQEGHGNHVSHGAAAPEQAHQGTPVLRMAATGVDAKTASDTANETAPGKRVKIRSASDDATRLHNMAMAHTTHIYLLNKEGQVVRYIYPSLTPEQLAKRLTDLVNDG